MKGITSRSLRIISMIRLSAKATPAFAGIKVAVSTDRLWQGRGERGQKGAPIHQSRWMEREVVLLVQSPDIMKLGIGIARTARVRTWCQRRNNLEVLAPWCGMDSLDVQGGRTHTCTRAHVGTRARANSCANIYNRSYIIRVRSKELLRAEWR